MEKTAALKTKTITVRGKKELIAIFEKYGRISGAQNVSRSQTVASFIRLVASMPLGEDATAIELKAASKRQIDTSSIDDEDVPSMMKIIISVTEEEYQKAMQVFQEVFELKNYPQIPYFLRVAGMLALHRLEKENAELGVVGESVVERQKPKTIKDKIKEAEKKGIYLPNLLAKEETIVGVYEIFQVRKDERRCLYIGKSTDIAYRLLSSGGGGHINSYLKGDISRLVPMLIDKNIKDGCQIEVCIIPVDYHDTCFSKAAHRLALAEIQEIVKYQSKNECIYQVPEAVGINEERFWEEHYKIEE